MPTRARLAIQAMKKVFGVDTNIDVIKHHGSTDPLILVSVLQHHGVPHEQVGTRVRSEIKQLPPRTRCPSAICAWKRPWHANCKHCVNTTRM